MILSLYNVLSHLISGFLVYLVFLHYFALGNEYTDPLSATAIAFILGYFVNSLSAWIEWILYWSWGGIPSTQLLEGKSCGRIRFSEHNKARDLLKKRLGMNNPKTDDLFKLAIRLSGIEGRISEMNGQYAFSRSIMMAVLITVVVLSIDFYDSYKFWLIAALTLIVAWKRNKERGFYYAREVLFVALNKLEESGNPKQM